MYIQTDDGQNGGRLNATDFVHPVFGSCSAHVCQSNRHKRGDIDTSACNPGDLDGDYDVDFADFLAFAGVWGTTYPRPTQLTDRDVLVSLYNATNGQTWRNSANWLTDNDLSTWHGVFATNGRVWGINLEGNNLNGTISPELGKLSHLSHLNLASNRLSGTIPPELGELPKLTELVLAYNQLSGPIPPELGNLYNLRLIHFAGTFLLLWPICVFSNRSTCISTN